MTTRKVAAVAGRRIDAADADQPRFPLEQREPVRGRLLELFRQEQIGTLVCAAACGADLLALDAAAALGLELHIVLPFAPARFRETSVVDRPGDWGALFDRLTRQVATEGHLVDLKLPENDDATYQRANVAILDRAAALAGDRGEPPLAVVVWDGGNRGSGDVTIAFREEAGRRGWPVIDVFTLDAR